MKYQLNLIGGSKRNDRNDISGAPLVERWFDSKPMWVSASSPHKRNSSGKNWRKRPG